MKLKKLLKRRISFKKPKKYKGARMKLPPKFLKKKKQLTIKLSET